MNDNERNTQEELSDDLNPKYIFSTTATKLLVQIVNNEIDVKQLAQDQLKNRGLNNEGLWVGFNHER